MSDGALGIGRRVLVTGMAGSGKSTFSRSLAAKTGLPVIHLDLHFWKPGWVAPSEPEWRDKQRGPARRRRVDRGRQLPRDPRPSPRTSGHSCGSRHPLVGVRGTRAPPRPAEAGWGDARRVRRFVLATVARRVAFGHRYLAESPLRAPSRTRDHFAVRAARGPSRARVQTGS